MDKLLKKLRLNKDDELVILNRPNENYFADMNVIESLDSKANYIVIFVTNIEELTREVMNIVTNDMLLENGRIFVAYAKKGNKMYESFVHRDEIFPALKVSEEDGYIPNSDYKFNQMVSLDEVFTIVGIKKETKKTKKSKANSGRVDDYTKFIIDIEERISDLPKTRMFFDNLTQGYKKSWARYIYSAKKVETQEKRFQEMIALLDKGIKYK